MSKPKSNRNSNSNIDKVVLSSNQEEISMAADCVEAFKKKNFLRKQESLKKNCIKSNEKGTRETTNFRIL